MTCFLDIAMFWMNVMWVYCLQWHLCCRLGFVRFWAWAALLGFVSIENYLFNRESKSQKDGNLESMFNNAYVSIRPINKIKLLIERQTNCLISDSLHSDVGSDELRDE